MKFGYVALRRLVDDWVHGSALRDPLAAARHRLFIGGAMAEGLLALAAFPVFVAWRGAPGWSATGAFALLAAPLLLAVLVSRTGNLALGQLLRSGVAAGLMVWLAGFGLGAAPVLLAGLLLLLVEAALTASRRVAALVAVMALGAGAALALIGTGAPAADPVVPVLAAILYAGALALKVHVLGREAEEATASLAAGFRLLSDHATDMVTRHGSDGGVRFASASVKRLCGVPPAELRGRGFFARVHVADRPAFLTAIADAMDGVPTVLRFKLERRDDDGLKSFFLAEMRGTPAREADGGKAAVVVTRDVSQEAEREAALALAEEQAGQASLAKSAFLAHMSHELRTPLNAIIGFSEILKDETLDRLSGERRRDYASLIHTSGRHLLSVVNEILDLTKIEAGRMEISTEAMEVPALVEESLSYVETQAHSKNIRIVRNIAASFPEIEADPRACRQMLINLLSNAVKFSHPGGSVAVCARVVCGALELSVKDCGIGIAASDLAQLGKPFFQADSAYDRRFEGTGLGLSVVTKLAELHGGSLKVESELGKGTMATVILPIARRSEATTLFALPEPDYSFEERKRA